jgi:Raf kinase inhibitor-like YbhB/YbcL family protein
MLEKLPDVIGHALREQRAGIEKTAFRRFDLRGGLNAIRVMSLAFGDHAPIPALYTADGDGRSPPLSWSGVPETATSVVLLVEDADAPTPQPLVHAIAVDLPGGDGALAEGALSAEAGDAATPHLGRHSLLGSGWLPPDPPPGHGVHRYAFQVFALQGDGVFSGTPGRDDVLEAIAERAVASGCLVGTYERPDTAIRVEDVAPGGVAPAT